MAAQAHVPPCAVNMSTVNSAHAGSQPMISCNQIQGLNMAWLKQLTVLPDCHGPRGATRARRLALTLSTPSSQVAPLSLERSWRMRKRSAVMSLKRLRWLLLGLGICVLACAVPAWRASRVPVARALSYG